MYVVYRQGHTQGGQTCGAPGFTSANFNNLGAIGSPVSNDPRAAATVNVKGLMPNSPYCFSVADDDENFQQFHRTMTAAAPITPPTPTTPITPNNTAADAAVLPEILRQQHRGIHNGIFNRILQRQRADGKWK